MKETSMTIHERNLQSLAIEVYKSINNSSPVIMKGIFDVKNIPYNLRSTSILCTRNVRTVKNGFNTLSFRRPKIWALSNTLQEFKSKIRKWKPVGCDCNICKVYIPNLGFL